MSAGNFTACHAVTAWWEGGYVDHPSDPGGATNWGITIRTLAAWRKRPVTKAEVKALTRAEAEQIFKANYWIPVGAETMPRGVDLCAYDEGVNSGPARGKNRYRAAIVKSSEPAQIVKLMCAGRRSFLQGLNTFRTFGKGWMSRVANVEAIAFSWALAQAGVTKEAINRKMATEAAGSARSAETKSKNAKTAGTATAGAGGAAAGDAAGPQVVSWNWEGIAFLVVVLAIAGGFAFILWHGSRGDRERAKAFQEAANGPV